MVTVVLRYTYKRNKECFTKPKEEIRMKNNKLMNAKIIFVEDLLEEVLSSLYEISEVTDKYNNYILPIEEIYDDISYKIDSAYEAEDTTIHSVMSGIVEFGKEFNNNKRLLVVSKDESEIVEYLIPKENENNLRFKEGDEIKRGDVLIYKNPIMQKESA